MLKLSYIRKILSTATDISLSVANVVLLKKYSKLVPIGIFFAIIVLFLYFGITLLGSLCQEKHLHTCACLYL